MYQIETYKGLQIAWLPELDGGGRGSGQQYVSVVRSLFGRVDRLYEPFAGPGFVAFSLLAEGLCNSVCLSDINPKAVAAVKETIRLNNLEDKVSVYCSDMFDQIPDTEKWDLITGNPPHVDASQQDGRRLRSADPGWRMHRTFYANLRRFLKPHANCLMLESHNGSDTSTFIPMLEGSGMRFAGSFMTSVHVDYNQVSSRRYPRNHYHFFWTRVDHPELQWLSETAPTTIELRLGAQSAEPGEPVQLAVGDKYAFHFVNGRAQRAHIEFLEARGGGRTKLRIPPEGRDLPVTIHTAPGTIVDVETGHVLAIFT